MKNGFIIAIDGPLASGKGTIAKRLASVLHGIDLYTGAMYRGLALYCLEHHIDMNDAASVIEQLPKITFKYQEDKIFLNNEDVTQKLQEPKPAAGSSVVGVIPEVRRDLVKRQRALGLEMMEGGKIVIVEGRDIGTVVFPDAALRLYLTASEEVRAKRRLLQYQDQGGSWTFEKVLETIRVRDTRDKERKTDPLASNPEELGYTVLDNSDINESETIDTIISMLKERKLYPTG
ncbi:MAG TPA: (d)CMP kinase [Candidatus Saccharimonadales bacterium]|nr:(d)CMP kinase [Candidatus Saccharimonadales bacterium]